MTMHLTMPESRYLPSAEAAEHEKRLAEDQYETIRNMPVDESLGYIPLPDLERLRSARARYHTAQDLARAARMRDGQRKNERVWS